MAQANYTPVSLYYSTNVAAVPSAANLTNGELAINIATGRLYYKNSSGTVVVLADGNAAALAVPVKPSQGGTGIVNNDASTLTITGNFATNLTVTAATAVTLPTTGTLATLAGNETLSNKTLTNATISTVTAPLTVSVGGTGQSTLTQNNVLLGNGTSSVVFVAPGTSGNVLTSNGTTWVSQTPSAGGITTGKAIAMALIFGF